MYDPQVHIHKTVLMQRILDAVSRGYVWHTAGVVPLHRASAMANKFSELYHVHRNDNQRAYARRTGKASAKLMLWAQTEDAGLHWWLLATEGIGLVHELEQLVHACSPRGRVRIDEDYELVRRTRSHAKGGGTVWSWRMTHECVNSWRERIIMACRRTDSLVIMRAMGPLYRSPGFSGVRVQVGKLVALARQEWRRRHGSLDALVMPPALPYVERLVDTSVPLSSIHAG